MNTTERIEENLKKENEGNVFAHVWVSTCFNTLFVHRDYYIVKNGLVCIIEGDKFTPTGDTVFKTTVECVKIGRYNSKNKYEKSFKEMSYKEIKKAIKF